jgi:hypothetical protein
MKPWNSVPCRVSLDHTCRKSQDFTKIQGDLKCFVNQLYFDFRIIN